MKKGIALYSLVGVALISLSSLFMGCSRRAEQISAEEMAEQMEAGNEGREAAKAIITREWKDTMQLQQAILEARAANSKYEMEGKSKCKEAFDTAFFNTIRTVRPDLANEIAGVR